MAKTTNKQPAEETLFQKEKRLKARKQDFALKYKKGIFYASWAHDKLKGYLDQPDVIVRVHSTGTLDDDKAFIQITIEGFVAPEDGI